jgi:DNA-binding transcriptional ArsR family regulator
MGDVSDEDAPDAQAVFAALGDPDCRAIVQELSEPMTAAELSEACEIPSSTLYRKLDSLREASLVTERSTVRRAGGHTTRYAVAFEQLQIALTEDGSFAVAASRPERTADERFSDVWSEMRKET